MSLRMLLRLDFSTIFIVCFSIVCRIVTIFDCRLFCSVVWRRWIPLENTSVFRLQREICFLCLSQSCRIRSLCVFVRVRDLILRVHLRTVNARVSIGYDLKLLSDFVTHSHSCWSCCLQLVPIFQRRAPWISFLERVSLHLVIICTLVLSLGTHRVERTCCDCGLSTRKL